MQTRVIRMPEEIMSWYPHIHFIEGTANGPADWLSRHPRVAFHTEPMVPPPISFQTRQLDVNNDDYLRLVEQFLVNMTLPVDLGVDDLVAVKRSTSKFLMQDGWLFREFAHVSVPVKWPNE